MTRIRVYVIKQKGSRSLLLRYVDPISGKCVRATTYTDSQSGQVFATGENRKEAKKLAVLWEQDLNMGRAVSRCDISWSEFRQRYEDEHVPSLALRTADKINTALDAVERILPKVKNGKLTDLNAEAISRFQSVLRAESTRAEDTIKTYMNHLRAALSWAVEQEMIFKAPTIKKVQRAKKRGGNKGKGRAITTEEFERMLAAVPAAVADWRKRKRHAARKTARKKGIKEHKTKTDQIPVEVAPATVESWRRYLTGLWLSGLRLAESLAVYWDRPDRLCVDLTGKRPRLLIPAKLEKGHRDRVLPITPDFAEFLLAIPEAKRRGPVFRPLMPSGNRPDARYAGQVVSLIGMKARVVVHTNAKTGRVKYASAHDLRRSFGTRWAKKVMPAVLQKLMRHETISTTMGYYVDIECDEIAEQLWATGSTPEAGSNISEADATSS